MSGSVRRRRKRKVKTGRVGWIRRFALGAVLAFFVLVPLSAWYANNKIAYNQARLVALADGEVMGWIYGALDALYSLWDDPVTAATSNNGSLWAMTVFGIPLSDPLGLIAELLNSVAFPVKYLIGGLIPFAIVLILGRVFCSWICPMTVLFNVTSRIRALMEKAGFPLLAVRLDPSTRAFVLFGGLILSHIFGAWVWHFVLPYISLTHEMFSIIVFSSLTTGVYFLAAILVLVVGRLAGEYCRSLCPTGYLLEKLGKYSFVTLRVPREDCPKGCTRCEQVCPIGLYPAEGRLTGCHLCYACVENCPKEHIQLGMNPIYSRLGKPKPENGKGKLWDFSPSRQSRQG